MLQVQVLSDAPFHFKWLHLLSAFVPDWLYDSSTVLQSLECGVENALLPVPACPKIVRGLINRTARPRANRTTTVERRVLPSKNLLPVWLID